jgi:hypothetical protein
MTLDNGYQSGKNLEALEPNQIEAYIPIDRNDKKPNESLEESNRSLVKAEFLYDEENDCFKCPGEQCLELKTKDKNGKCVYQGDANVCAGCQYQARCCQSKTGAARTINTDSHEGLRQKMRERMEREESKEIYKQRQVIVEPVFAQTKNGGFRGFSVRGLDKVAGEFSLVCAAHNLKKMVKAIITGSVRPMFGKIAPQKA